MMAAGVGLAVAVGITGCGQVQKLSAKDTVSDALSGLENAKSATFTARLDTTAADFAAISKAQGDPLSASDQKILAKVLSGDVVIAMKAPDGKTFGDSAKSGASPTGADDLKSLLGDPKALSEALEKQGDSAFAVRLGGTSLVDVRSLDGKVYARADVNQILTLADQDPALVQRQLAGLPPALAPLAKAAKGEWVSIDLAKAAAAAKDSGLLNAIPTPTAAPTVDAAKLQRLLDSLKAAYKEKATITDLGDAGDRGTGYRLSAPAKQVAQAVTDDLISLVGKDSEAEIRKSISEIPNKTFSLDVWVKDDKLSHVALDLTQFLDKPVTGKKLAVDIAVAVDSADVSAPSGATEIDLKSILGQLPPGAFGGGAKATSTSFGAGGAGSLSPAQITAVQQQTGLSEEEINDLVASSK
jgi:hypothetical protein